MRIVLRIYSASLAGSELLVLLNCVCLLVTLVCNSWASDLSCSSSDLTRQMLIFASLSCLCCQFLVRGQASSD